MCGSGSGGAGVEGYYPGWVDGVEGWDPGEEDHAVYDGKIYSNGRYP